jgi:hypothetical protein
MNTSIKLRSGDRIDVEIGNAIITVHRTEDNRARINIDTTGYDGIRQGNMVSIDGFEWWLRPCPEVDPSGIELQMHRYPVGYARKCAEVGREPWAVPQIKEGK